MPARGRLPRAPPALSAPHTRAVSGPAALPPSVSARRSAFFATTRPTPCAAATASPTSTIACVGAMESPCSKQESAVTGRFIAMQTRLARQARTAPIFCAVKAPAPMRARACAGWCLRAALTRALVETASLRAVQVLRAWMRARPSSARCHTYCSAAVNVRCERPRGPGILESFSRTPEIVQTQPEMEPGSDRFSGHACT
jgi:hypothetical protein